MRGLSSCRWTFEFPCTSGFSTDRKSRRVSHRKGPHDRKHSFRGAFRWLMERLGCGRRTKPCWGCEKVTRFLSTLEEKSCSGYEGQYAFCVCFFFFLSFLFILFSYRTPAPSFSHLSLSWASTQWLVAYCVIHIRAGKGKCYKSTEYYFKLNFWLTQYFHFILINVLYVLYVEALLHWYAVSIFSIYVSTYISYESKDLNTFVITLTETLAFKHFTKFIMKPVRLNGDQRRRNLRA